jgi:tRNA threonylcarbamoyladenosine biosynthesis protein TsaB
MLDTSGVGFGDLTAIAVDIGPGLFTGIRVGVSAAMGFAVALGLPVVGLTSTDILALGCEAAGQTAAVGVVDLRRGEVAWSLPPVEEGDSRVNRHGSPAALAEDLVGYLDRLGVASATPPLVLAGDGAIRYGEMLTVTFGRRIVIAGPELAVPPVASLALRAVTELSQGRGVDPSDVRPVYLRDADVRINWTTRHDAPGRNVEVA